MKLFGFIKKMPHFEIQGKADIDSRKGVIPHGKKRFSGSALAGDLLPSKGKTIVN